MRKVVIFLLFLSIGPCFSQMAPPTGLALVCDQIDKVSTLINPIISNPWSTLQITPTGPVYGVIMVTTQGNRAVSDFCAFYNRLRQLEGADKLFLAGDYLNTLTNNKYNDHLTFLRSSYDLGSSIDNLNKTDAKMLDKMVALAPQLNSYLGSVNDYYASNTGNEIEALNGRQTQEARMQTIMNATRENSVYSSLLKCGEPKDPDINYYKDIASSEEQDRLLETDINYLIATLRDMGLKFSDSKNYEAMLNDLNEFVSRYVSYTATLQTRHTTITLRRNKKVKPKDPSADPTESYQSPVKRDYQVFTTSTNEDLYIKFVKTYGKTWKEFVTSNALSETKGFLLGPSSQFQKQFKDYNFACRDSSIYELAKTKNPDLFLTIDDPKKQEFLNQLREECLVNEKKNTDSKIDNLFVDYLEILKASIVKSKKLRGDIWGMDSFYNGTLRIIDKGDIKNGNVQEEITCSQDMSLASMKAIRLKQSQTNGKLRMAYYEEEYKKTTRMTAKAIADKADKDAADTKAKLDFEANRRREQEYNQYMNYPAMPEASAKAGF